MELVESNGETPNPHVAPSNHPIKIGFYSDAAEWAGAEIALGTLLSGLSDRFQATIIGVVPETVERLLSYRPKSRAEVLPNPSGLRDIRNMMFHRQAISALKLEIFQANLAWGPSCREAIVAASTIPGLKLIAVEHLPIDHPGTRSRLTKYFTSRRLDAHVAVGLAAARSIESRAMLPKGSLRIIYNGVVDHGLTQDESPRSGPMLIGCLARLDRVKGLDILLRCLVDLPGAEVVIAGRGPERAALEKLAKDLKVWSRVTLLDWVESPDSLMKSFDVFALPSRAEGFPLSILEAMLAGLPVVATDVGSVKEAVIDGMTGFVVDPDDVAGLTRALRRLIDQPELRQKFGAEARAVAVEKFTSAAMVANYEALYVEVLRQQ